MTAEERDLAERMLRARDRFGVSLEDFGVLFGTDASQTYKLEAGLNRIRNGRVTIVEIVERALARADAASPPLSPRHVWGSAELTPAERLARLCAFAFPEVRAA